MPQLDSPGVAIMWDLQAPFSGNSDDGRQTAVLSGDHLSHCFGFSRYSICHQVLATAECDSSCLARLFFENLVRGMKYCDIKLHTLPSEARATNLRYGVWLIERATNDFQTPNFSLGAPSPLPVSSYDGCTIYIITLACGHKLIGPDFTVLTDLESCDAAPPTFIHVDLPDALSHILSNLPPLDQLPTYNTKTSAKLDHLHSPKNDIAIAYTFVSCRLTQSR